jgi:hypothetical protein
MLLHMLQPVQREEIKQLVVGHTDALQVTNPIFTEVTAGKKPRFIHKIGMLFEDPAAAHEGHINIE